MSDKEKRIGFIIGAVILSAFVLLVIFAVVGSKKSGSLAAQRAYPAGKSIPTLIVKPTSAANAALPQTLDLTFSYKADSQELALVRKSQINGVARAVTDTALPYELWEVDANNTIIFDTRFAVTTALYTDSPYNTSGMQQLESSETTVSVPYVPTAQTIIVTKANKRILVFPIK